MNHRFYWVVFWATLGSLAFAVPSSSFPWPNSVLALDIHASLTGETTSPSAKALFNTTTCFSNGWCVNLGLYAWAWFVGLLGWLLFFAGLAVFTVIDIYTTRWKGAK